jgi:hypothetical protein
MIRNTEHLQPGCPWYEISEFRLPNIKWCEENLCSWVVNPANTWSNLAFLVAALWVASWAKQPQFASAKPAIRKLSVGLVVVGLGSFIYHQSYAFLTQILDFFGMFWFLWLVFFINRCRSSNRTHGHVNRIRFEFTAWLMTITASTGIMIAMDYANIAVQPLILYLGGILLIQEIQIYRLRPSPHYRWLVASITILLLAAFCSFVDLKRLICDPSNHWMQGHALWHLFSAAGLVFLSKHLVSDLSQKRS